MTLLIKNALTYKGNAFKKSDVFIKDGIIHSLSISISDSIADRVIDAQGKYFLIPGFVDVHTHLRQPGFSYKETIKSGTMAAARAGYTTIFTMPNLNPPPDCVENLKAQTDIIEKDAVINVLPFGTITKDRKGAGSVIDFASIADNVAGFSDDGTGVQTDELMEKAMTECAKLNKIISAHCEVNELLNGGYIHDGEYCKANGHKGICSESEWAQIERDCLLAEKTGCQYHVCHISTKESVDIIRKAKQRGVNVTCETGPHYLTMCDKDLQEDGRFKMNPPLRAEEDMKALIDGVIDGTVDVIATDHAPHSDEEKAKGLAGSLMGVVGLETAFAVLNTKLVKTGVITLEKLVYMMSVRPREIFGLDGGKIEEGEIADLALLDADKLWKVDPEKFVTKGRATPFKDWQVQGENLMTICKGEIVYDAL
ncbi:MAG: dihydroorotase [Acetobacter sp.]|nr:dihydroorotase [Bacteroides sp.]MCM1340664.1 dihydroorotase [Acetobacter sp.]MCM1433775.1 dihydroorotase [Clostridiales bacterium]